VPGLEIKRRARDKSLCFLFRLANGGEVVRPSRPIGAERAAGKGGSERTGRQAGPNPYTRATKGQKEGDPTQPKRGKEKRGVGGART
jgi:hypothetical protein